MEPSGPISRRRLISGAAQPLDSPNSADAGGMDGFDRFDDVPNPYWLRFARAAMATQFQLLVVAGVDDSANAAASTALDEIQSLEAQLSIYREDSEVSAINRRAAAGPVAVEPQLLDLLRRADRISLETGGAYDVTSGPIIDLWQAARRVPTIPDAAAIAAVLTSVGSRHLGIDLASGTVRFGVPGMKLNLGAIGKGYALDRSATRLVDRGIEHFLWHGGQSSVLCRGSAKGPALPAAGWIIGVGHPLKSGRRLAELVVRNRAVGTSGAGFQFYRHEGKRYGHILDPRTGWPAEGVFSVTVLAPSAAEADALSTAFYVLGYDGAADYCTSHPDVGFLMLLPAAGGTAVELATCGLDDRDWRLSD